MHMLSLDPMQEAIILDGIETRLFPSALDVQLPPERSIIRAQRVSPPLSMYYNYAL
jgi:hypothetical protein